MSGDSNATWIDAVKSRKRPARRLVLTEGDVGAQRTTKIGGAPWWPRDEPRNPAIGWYPPGTIGMEDLMHPKASDLGFIPADGRPNDGMGVVTRAAIKAYGVALDDIDEIPVPDDLPETIDLPDDFFGGTDLDPERPEGFAFVARCKIGGWPAWDQSARWPTCEHHGQAEFVAEIDHEVGADTHWGGGGHAFLFACPPGCIDRRAELVIQTT